MENADFTERHPDIFIEDASQHGIESAARFGTDINNTEKLWGELTKRYRLSAEDTTFTELLLSLDRLTLGKLVLLGLYREHEREETGGRNN